MALLYKALLPRDLLTLSADGINQIWRKHKLRAVGKKRAQGDCGGEKEHRLLGGS